MRVRWTRRVRGTPALGRGRPGDKVRTRPRAAYLPAAPMPFQKWRAFTGYTYTPRRRSDVRAVGRAIPRGWPFTSSEGWPCTRQQEPKFVERTTSSRARSAAAYHASRIRGQALTRDLSFHNVRWEVTFANSTSAGRVWSRSWVERSPPQKPGPSPSPAVPRGMPLKQPLQMPPLLRKILAHFYGLHAHPSAER